MTPKDKNAVRTASQVDRCRWQKDGTVEFKRSYFYRMGMDAEGFANRVADRVRAAGYEVTDVQASDRWAAWPKTSYFVATMQVKPKKAD